MTLPAPRSAPAAGPDVAGLSIRPQRVGADHGGRSAVRTPSDPRPDAAKQWGRGSPETTGA